MVDTLQKGYMITLKFRSQKEAFLGLSSKNEIFALITCKKVRIGEAIHNLIKILNTSNMKFPQNEWGPDGGNWNEKLKKELLYYTEDQRKLVEWMEMDTLCLYFESFNILAVKSTDKIT
jgi:hypothetical protein